MNRTPARTLLVSFAALSAYAGTFASGCGEPEDDCPAGGQGSVLVEVNGLPPAAASSLTLVGSEKTFDVAGAGELTELPTGRYTVSAYRVAAPSERVRRAFSPLLDTPQICVRAGEASLVRVGHREILSSGKLWGVGSGGAAPIVGLASDRLLTSSSDVAEADVAITANPATTQLPAVAFDEGGNLWVVDRRAEGSSIRKFLAEELGTSGTLAPEVDLRGEALQGTPGPQGLAFDADGNLWVSVSPSNTLVRYTPQQLARSGQPEPEVVLGGTMSGVVDPSGLAFDREGNLWVASFGSSRVVRFRASRLKESTAAPDLILEAKSAQPVVATLGSPKGIAFDARDNMWVSYSGQSRLARFTPDERSGMGELSITPPVQLTLQDAALDGLAFDEGGGLWTPYGQDQLARLAPSQLAAGGQGDANVVPDTVLEGAAIGTRVGLALYPAPAGVPLISALP